jgi:hypothetical protein
MNSLDIGSYLTKQIESRSADSGRRIRSTAQTLRTIATELRNDPATSSAADFAERGAQIVDDIGSYFERSDFNTMMWDAQRVSRERPWLVATVGLAAGMLASRLVKATAAHQNMADRGA